MRRIALAATLLLLALTACSGGPAPAFKATDITGADLKPEFELTDHNGGSRTLADFRGKVVVVFFGYTHCPDVCPTSLAHLAGAMQELGPTADRVQVLFITVDPERDTKQLMARYVTAFNPTFLGLAGDAAATARAARSFKVVYQQRAGQSAGSYTMDHSAGTFIFDPQGRLRLYVSYGQGADVFAHDIDLLLKSKG